MTVGNNYLVNVWNQVLDFVKISLGENNTNIFNTYCLNTSLFDLSEDNALVVANNGIQKKVLDNYKNIIEDGLFQVLDKEYSCNILLENDLNKFNKSDNSNSHVSNLVKTYLFENFVEGSSNRECFSAALASTVNPGQLFNPIFIYGNSGLGKTHLLHAIGNQIMNTDSDKKVLYISSSDFVTKVVDSIKNGSIEAYKEYLYAIDILLVDDIQFLAGKEKSHEIFFHVFNNLVNQNKQIVLTSDRLPSEINGLENRLISRFSSGLSVGMDSPEFETALAILKMKLQNHTIDCEIIDDDVLSYLASNFSSDIRSLEGSLNRLIFYSINFSNNQRIDLKTALSAFKGYKIAKAEISLSTIKKIVSDYYGLTVSQLNSKNRTKNISSARHIAMYLCRKHLDLSFSTIGMEFGKRDHSTVINAYEKIEKSLSKDLLLKQAIIEIEKNFSS